jgi:TPR repeat protein
MKSVILTAVLLLGVNASGELPILNTPFHNGSLETVEQQAGKNNPDAQMELALRYYAGHQVTPNPGLAFEWMSRAAAQASPEAQFLLSRMVAEGIGTAADEPAANEWFAKAIAADPENRMLQAHFERSLAEMNPESAQRFLQVCSDAGYVLAFAALQEPVAVDLYSKGDYKEALRIFQLLAESGSPAGNFRLAGMYAAGLGGLPEDHLQAFDLYSTAAEAGHPEAQYELARMMEAGTGTDRDADAAAEWYEKAAQNGNAKAQFQVAEMNFASAVRSVEQAALQTEDEAARLQLMKKYKQDLSGSVAWYRKAAEGNIAAAQYMLGRLYASGEGVFKNMDEALQYHKLAAEQGYAESLFYIGLMYHAGTGISKDVDKAFFFYQKAAERGSRGAMFYLGNCTCFGEGTEPHAAKGESFYLKALDGADLDAAIGTGDSAVLKNPWVLRAAREYAVILWRKAASKQDAVQAGAWMSLAARGGDPDARRMLVDMTAGAPGGRGIETDHVRIAGKKADPLSDAAAFRRDSVFLYPYLMENIRTLYPAAKFPQIIMGVLPRGETRSIDGRRLWELAVKYLRLPGREAVGLRGRLLIGVEFEDPDTGETFWAFNELKDQEAVFSGATYIDVSLFADLSDHPDAEMRSWAVTYGHLIDADRKMLAVLDGQKKSKSAASLEQMASVNRFAAELPSSVVASIDVNARFPGDIEDPDAGDSDSDSMLDSIISTLTGE